MRIAKSTALQMLNEKVCSCTRCDELARTRTQTVFGEGNPNADIFFLGEAPGQNEDETGRPFVGKAGQLLDDIIKAAGWKREDIFIANILKCRPPGNRNPTSQEAANCKSFLSLQIKVIDPRIIICWGKVAAFYLLGGADKIEDVTMGQYRQLLHEYEGRKVLCTYHPSYLLRNPAAKKDVWDDLMFLKKAL
jgi:DNA polymerase